MYDKKSLETNSTRQKKKKNPNVHNIDLGNN